MEALNELVVSWAQSPFVLLAVLVVVLIAVIIALAFPNNDKDETPSGSSTPPASSSAPPPSPTATNVEIVEEEFLGLTQAEAKAKLDALELQLKATTGNVAPTKAQEGRSYLVDPIGTLSKGDVVTVTFYAPIPTPGAPGAAGTDTPAPYTPGQVVAVTWSQYNGCPAGHALTGYSFEVDNGRALTANPIDRNATSVDVQLRPDAGDTKVRYTAICDDIQSTVSDWFTLTVTTE